jgi:hypothetical protein
MERLASDRTESEGERASVLDLLDRVWRMHPDASPVDILACALELQVGHLSLLPVGGGWMMRFLRDLPTFIPADAPIPPSPPPEVEEDVTHALQLRLSAQSGRPEAVYRDAAGICDVALRHMTPGTVCRIAIRAYQRA